MNAPVSPMHPGPELFDRAPPHNFEAEQALLGAILMSNRALENVSEFLRSEHFASGFHGRLYDACLALAARGHVASPVTLKNYFGEDPDLKEMGGDEFLVRLAAAAVSIINAEDYGRLILDLSLRRSLIGIGEDLVNDAFDMSQGTSIADMQERHEAALLLLSQSGGAGEDRTEQFTAAIDEALAGIDAAWKSDRKLSGVSTGLTELDAKIGGLHQSDLLILAGRPSMGKSALAQAIAEAAARANKVVAFFSLEMGRDQIAMRSISAASGIQVFRLREGRISVAEAVRANEAGLDLKALPIFLDDTGGLTVAQIRARSRRIKRKQGLDLIVIDYLQLMRGASTGRGTENRTQEVSEITRGLKALAKELQVPILALSQLSRQVESRDDKRPQLADLRESGSIEQDADVVMFVYREQYYLERAEPNRRGDESDDKFNTRYSQWEKNVEATLNIAEIIIGKQRHGPTGTVKLFFDGNLTKFGNLASEGGLL